jgi:flagellin
MQIIGSEQESLKNGIKLKAEEVSGIGQKRRVRKVRTSHAEKRARCDGYRSGAATQASTMGSASGKAPQITASNKENPMSLGVLNNLSAVYAENNLNNTDNSLNTVLQQLSSGSKINSGADDAAGLSLVDGLQANQQALTQSQTNATEGVGLLQVADGALSQVTSLLNRAVTLATEASNGTLNSSQDAAANQEYQSILSEVSNIGTTTSYNQNAVFNSTTDIYTGDSSSKGSSIDSLNIRSLSSSNVGDTGGAMSYTGGQSVFINLSTATANAQSTDTLTGGSGGVTSTIDVSYLRPDGSTATSTISVGATTTYANSVSGLVDAINGSGLGLTATFGTGAQAGESGAAATETGIIISGSVGTGAAPTTTTFNNEVTNSAAATAVADTETTAGAFAAGVGGTATISYTDSQGANLSTTSLTSQANAETALTGLNAAISDVAAQDGYIGAQINTLNAVSSVLSTQQENVQSAQNAVQATDYAAASSNMSKYEILSQTGISALAQANSMQQEVTKLLQ